MTQATDKPTMKYLAPLIAFVCCYAMGCLAEVQDLASSSIDPEVQSCIERSAPRISLKENISLLVSDDKGVVSEMSAEVYWKRFENDLSKAVIRFTDPPHKSRIALLLEQSDDMDAEPAMTIYLPELRSTRRIVGTALNGSMFGTGFSYDDFAQLQHVINHRKVRILDAEELDGRANYVLETLPNSEYSDYRRVVTLIDKEWCIPVRTRFYGVGGQLFKEMLVVMEDVRQLGDRVIPYRTVLSEHTGGHTEIRVNEVEVDADLRDRIFTPSDLGRGK